MIVKHRILEKIEADGHGFIHVPHSSSSVIQLTLLCVKKIERTLTLAISSSSCSWWVVLCNAVDGGDGFRHEGALFRRCGSFIIRRHILNREDGTGSSSSTGSTGSTCSTGSSGSSGLWFGILLRRECFGRRRSIPVVLFDLGRGLVDGLVVIRFCRNRDCSNDKGWCKNGIVPCIGYDWVKSIKLRAGVQHVSILGSPREEEEEDHVLHYYFTAACNHHGRGRAASFQITGSPSISPWVYSSF